ncbi:MAG: hypothetical protein IMW83_00535 [Caldanaerobacter subterraneus]|nr:hypothetical protein [Caldanaerobacter subterraneus]
MRLSELLFDDIPWVRKIQEEHDEFVKILKENGVEVLYIERLLSEILQDEKVKEEFIEDILQLNDVTSPKILDFAWTFKRKTRR